MSCLERTLNLPGLLCLCVYPDKSHLCDICGLLDKCKSSKQLYSSLWVFFIVKESHWSSSNAKYPRNFTSWNTCMSQVVVFKIYRGVLDNIWLTLQTSFWDIAPLQRCLSISSLPWWGIEVFWVSRYCISRLCHTLSGVGMTRWCNVITALWQFSADCLSVFYKSSYYCSFSNLNMIFRNLNCAVLCEVYNSTSCCLQFSSFSMAWTQAYLIRFLS